MGAEDISVSSTVLVIQIVAEGLNLRRPPRRDITLDQRKVRLNFFCTLFFIGLAGSSVYIFPSGTPQPADFLLAVAAVLFLLNRARELSGILLLWPMVALTLWVGSVSLVWTALYPSGTFFKYPIFFVFNLTLMFVVINFFRALGAPRVFFAKTVEVALLVSGLGLMLTLVAPGVITAVDGFRITGFFNNPNQLAHYSLCMMGSLLVLHKGQLPVRFITLSAFASGVVGVFLSASFAAMAGFAFLISAFVLANCCGSRRLLRSIGTTLVVLVMVVGIELLGDGALSDRFGTRIEVVGDKVDSIVTDRGYHRVLAHPQYWVLGVGEGSIERFPGYGKMEIHSSLGNLLFAYGVIGLGLFLTLLWKALRNAPLYVWSVIAAPMVYSLTHMGLRTTVFWLLLAFVLVIYRKKEKTQSLTTPVPISR